MIHPGQGRVSSQELAALLRDQILAGELPPGARIPSDRYLQETHGVSRNLVRRAIATLRAEGLVVTAQGQTSRVRQVFDKQPIDMAGVVRVETRMPTEPERRALPERVDEGVPVFEVWRAGAGTPELLPGDRWYLSGVDARRTLTND